MLWRDSRWLGLKPGYAVDYALPNSLARHGQSGCKLRLALD